MTAVADLPARFSRDSVGDTVLVLDGYGLRVSVQRGHLTLDDGLGRTRRERRLTRAQRTVKRIVVLGHTGQITLDAVRWCHDTGISLTVLDTEGRVLLTAGAAGRNDARLRRAQAAAANTEVGVAIARAMISTKIDGQRAVATDLVANPTAAQTLHRLRGELAAAGGLVEIRALEATASNVYFGAWASAVAARFPVGDAARVPEHWTRYAVRRSPINRSSPRTAADPVNAMLNYSYALAESEARLALQALGLDPGIGIVHTDAKNRDSLALDLLEPLRPVAERHVLTLLDRRHLTRDDVHETRTGACRLLPSITHELAEAIPSYATAAARLAEQLAHALAGTVPGKITLTTPLSRINTSNLQTRGARSATRDTTPDDAVVKVRRTCQQCGTDLYGSARKLCPTCWPVARQAYMRQLGLGRAKPHEPQPTTEDLSGGITLQQYQQQILPALTDVSLLEMERVTGLTNGSCSRIRGGKQVPNPKYWAALASLGRRRTTDQNTKI